MSEENLKQKILDWDAVIPTMGKVKIEILSPKPRERLRAIILSDRPVSVFVHYWKGRTVRCTIDDGHCEPHDKVERRFKQYLAGWELGERQRYVLVEITHQAASDNAQLLDKGGPRLRGFDVTMSRRGRSNNSPLVLEFSNPAARSAASVPETFDVEEALLRIWNAPNRKSKKAEMAEQIAADGEVTDNDIPLPEKKAKG